MHARGDIASTACRIEMAKRDRLLYDDVKYLPRNKELVMSTTITIEAAQANLKDLVGRLAPGEELIITQDRQPAAKLVAKPSTKPRLRPLPGPGNGMITIVSDDDEHLEDFAEYMP